MASLTLAAYEEAERTVALVIVNVFVAGELPWSIFPVVGTGIGLFAHWYFAVARSDDMVRHHQLEIEQRGAA